MRNTKSNFKRAAVAVALVIGLTGCEDFGICGLTEDDLSMGDAFVETTGYFMNVVTRADQAMRDGDLQQNGTTTIDGATVTLANDSLTIDFGANNVSTADGKMRRGKIVGAITGDYFNLNGNLSLDLVNYHVDDVPITGNISLSNDGNNNGTAPWKVTLASSNFAIGNLYDYNSNLTMEWLNGYATTDSIEDDQFSIYGSAGGNDLQDSITFSTAFTEAMIFDRSCDYLVKEGVVEVSLTAGTAEVATVEVDFLDGDGINSDGCNNVLMLNASCEGTNVSFPQNFDGF